MNENSDVDVTKLQFLGSVEYAADFARLRPVLYSENGRTWDGLVKPDWFPNFGLVYTRDSSLKYAFVNSLWHFRVKPNIRPDAAEKDVFIVVLPHPAIELRTDHEPLDPEALRYKATESGFDSNPGGKGGVALPETEGRWVLAPEFHRDPDDDRWRPTAGAGIRHLKVFVGTPEDLCGMPTQTKRFALPPLQPGATGQRNWIPPGDFLLEFGNNLRQWAGVSVYKAPAQSAAQALRDLAPFLNSLKALRAPDAQAALIRARGLVGEADALATVANDLVTFLTETEPFKTGVEQEKKRIRLELEEEALKSIEPLVEEKRLQLESQLVGLKEEIENKQKEVDASQAKLSSSRQELVEIEQDLSAATHRKAKAIEELDRKVTSVVARATGEPAKVLAEWLGVIGFKNGYANEAVGGVNNDNAIEEPASAPEGITLVSSDELGRALFEASPARDQHGSRLQVVDAAIRARELPLLIGPLGREFAEAWLSVAGGGDPCMIVTDPTLLSLNDLTPSGPRGAGAPLMKAFARANSEPQRVVVVVLDDLDPAAAAFWLPEFARALRHPSRYGFPENLVALAIVEADATEMRLTATRAGELFPVSFGDCLLQETTKELNGTVCELPFDLVAPPRQGSNWKTRVAAFETAAAITFAPNDARSLAAAFAGYLHAMKGDDNGLKESDGLKAVLLDAAQLIVSARGVEKHA